MNQTKFFEKNYSDKAISLVQALDASLRSRAELEDTEKLQGYIQKFIYLNLEVLEISLNLPKDDELKVFVSSNGEHIGTTSSSYNLQSYEKGVIYSIPMNVRGSHILTVITPIHLSGQIVGTYEIILSMDRAYAALNIQIKNLVTISVFGLFILVISFMYALRKIILKPITVFSDAARMIGGGNLDTHVKINSRDELGNLAFVFNNMISELKQSRDEIGRYSKKLEDQVYERTKELEVSKEELRKKVEILEKNKTAMLNIMLDLKKTIADLEEAKRYINQQNIELKSVQNQLYRLNEELEKKVQERTAEVQRLLKQKDDFISQLGHDLKNPLTPLVGLLPILRDKEKDPKIKEQLDVIISNVNYMKDLVIKILQLARLNSPNIKFDIEDLNIKKEIDDIISNQQFFFEENNFKVENNIQDDIIVKADKIKLEELVKNLFTNAVKYTLDEKGKIVVDAEKKDGFVTVSIKDTGMGMTPEEIDHIFDEFYKADESRHDLDSSGLGLSICKRIVERHGGRIWAESDGRGKGSTFRFTLRLSEDK
ncbi:MAG: ATP-binding protein [Candidatus Thermoplasmatota archaeon]|jgi:signal transduction histidine kinase|nr:ATP-binding protein [Candidatus Thermoplasmatota archaeon]